MHVVLVKEIGKHACIWSVSNKSDDSKYGFFKIVFVVSNITLDMNKNSSFEYYVSIFFFTIL